MIKIHFLSVGHGDCTIIEPPSGNLTVVDINDRASFSEETERAIYADAGLDPSTYLMHKILGTKPQALKTAEEKLVDPVNFIKTHYPGRSVFRFICTHPDMDHLSGLYRLHKEQNVTIWNFWDIGHKKCFSDEDFKESPYKYEDWVWYSYLSGRLAPKYNSPATVIKAYRGELRNYWAQDGITVLHPTSEFLTAANDREGDNYNDCSYVLQIRHGESVVTLGGDAEESSWADIWTNHKDAVLASQILKASHHGRDSGYHRESVNAISPKYTVFSAGKKPSNDAYDKYKKHSTEVLRTFKHGTITAMCYEDGTVFLQDAEGHYL